MKIADLAQPQRINKAIELYLASAYDAPEKRAAHAVSVVERASQEEILSLFQDETEQRDGAHHSYTMRLGSAEYPNMKLAIHEAYFPGEYLLAVDRHDAFDIAPDTPEVDAWNQVRASNRRRKLQIEDSWYQAELPTLRRLKERLLQPADTALEFADHEILLVDDDADAGEILSMILRGSGFQCHWVGTIREAEAYIAANDGRCGMALIDIMLSDGNGQQVVTAVRNAPQTQDIPILLITGMNQTDVATTEQTHYLRKPYNSTELVACVRETLQREYDGHDCFLDDAAAERSN